MAESTPRSRSAGAKGNQAKRASTSRSAAARRTRSSQARSRPAANRARSANARSGGGAAASNGQQGPIDAVAETLGSAATKARGPMIAGGAAAAGALGGLVLGARVLRPRKKVLGIPVSRRGIGLAPMAHEVRKAGKQLERMVDEVGKARTQVQKVGKALS